MKKNFLRVVGVLAVSVSSLVVTPVGAATAKPSWHAPTRIAPSLGNSWHIACTTDTCFAATSAGILVSTNHRAWTRVTSSLVATTSIDEISCDTHGTTCEAFTSQGAAFVTSNDGVTWAKGVSLAPLIAKNYLNGVTCVANAFCVAHYSLNGGIESFSRATLSGSTLGTWSKLTTPKIYEAGEVACPTTANCIVAGMETGAYTAKSELLYSRNGGLSWTKASGTGFNSAHFDLTCAADGSALCLAGGNSSVSQLAADFGVLLRSTNYGMTWQRVTLDSSVTDFTRPACVSATNCLARSGAAGTSAFSTIYSGVQSTDGGSTWTTAPSLPTTRTPWLVRCVDSHGCFYVVNGAPLSIFFSADFSGWSSMTFPTSSTDVLGTTCVTTTVCFTTSFPLGAGANSPIEIYESTNGGSTWTYRGTLPDWMYYAGAMNCTSTTTCVAIGRKATGDATVIRTTDAGATWSAQELTGVDPAQASLSGLSCVATHCVVAGAASSVDLTTPSGMLLDSTDSGSTWHKISISLIGALRDVSCATATSCIAVGYSYVGGNSIQPVVYGTSDGTTWTVRSTGTKGGAFSEVSCTSVSNCVYAGIDGNYNAILATSTSGMTFTTTTYKNVSGTFLSCHLTLCVAGMTNDATDKPTYLVSTNSGKTFVTQTPTVKSLLTDYVVEATCPSDTFCLGNTYDGSFTKFAK